MWSDSELQKSRLSAHHSIVGEREVGEKDGGGESEKGEGERERDGGV